MSLRLKFILATIGCLAIVMALGGWYLNNAQVAAFESQARTRAEMVLNFSQACRGYVKQTLRPATEQHTDELVLEAMSSTFATRAIFDIFNESMPEYSYRQPALNPLNLTNTADKFEAEIIRHFNENRHITNVSGYRTANGIESYYTAKPIIVETECLTCHGSPEDAPASLVKRYGTTNGFYWQEGDVVSTAMISVPTTDLREQKTSLMQVMGITFISLTLALVFIVSTLFERLVNRRMRTAVEVMTNVALNPHSNKRLEDFSNDIIGQMSKAFNMMANNLLGLHRELEQRVVQRTSELSISEARNRGIVEAAGEGIIITDEAGKIIQVNPAFTKITGYSSEEVIGKAPGVLSSGKHSSEFYQAMWDTISTGKAWTDRLQNKHKDGRFYHTLLTTAPIMSDDNEISGYVGVQRDITEDIKHEEELLAQTNALSSANAELYSQKQQLRSQQSKLESANKSLAEISLKAEEANRTKSAFLANMSHEIRTPMTAILGYAELLLESNVTENERVKHINIIRNNGKHLLQLINDILDISKIEAGKMEVEQIDTSPVQILAEVTSMIQYKAEEKKIETDLRFETSMPAIITSDPTRLKQMIVNLVGNAIKFTYEGSVCINARFETEKDISYLVIEVVDTGIGMSPDQIDLLFKPFTQVDASTSRRFGGTGLGLTITNQLAELLNGEITVDSKPGKGSKFTLKFNMGKLKNIELIENPAELAAQIFAEQDTKQKSISTSISTDGSDSNKQARILFAEDGRDNQRLISTFLQKAGHEVIIAENGQIAMELALTELESGNPFDVIFMDMQMPVMDGYTATKKLRDAGYDLPIIALTAHAMASDRNKCLAAGCDDYAVKPIKRDILLDIVSNHVLLARQ